MKKSVLLLSFICVGAVLFAQTFTCADDVVALNGGGYGESLYSGKYVSFRDQKFTYSDDDGYSLTEIFHSSVSFSREGGVTFITLPEAGKRFLCLISGDFLVLYDGTSSEPWFFGNALGKRMEMLHYYTSSDFSASSELKEGNTVYDAGNLADFTLMSPWSEGAAGNGIGESVSFTCDVSRLYLFSGYVSYDKPYLYEMNARPKKIRITVTEKSGSREFIFDLADTPDPQVLEFPERMNGTAKLEILEVYPGTRYQDTCINAIIGQYL